MKRRGFTLIEMLVVLGLVLVLVAGVLVYLGARGGNNTSVNATARTLKDATQLRGIGQGMVLWADANDDRYPMPSMVDVNNTTVAATGRAKDTTGNIMSILAGHGFITTELLISSDEQNENIKAYEMYEVEEPRAAADPSRAHWDPGLSADFTSGQGGHVSFAHLIPDDNRLNMWTNTYKASEAVLANRGPEIARVQRANGNTVPTFANAQSLTTQFFQSAVYAWSGNVAYNDNHVDFNGDLYTHNTGSGATSGHNPIAVDNPDGSTTDYHDVLFHDEEGYPSNLFLGIFTQAGSTKDQYKAIWD